MTNRTSEQAFADAASGMVHADPVSDILSRLVKDCVAGGRRRSGGHLGAGCR